MDEREALLERDREKNKTVFDLTPFYTSERKGEDVFIFLHDSK